MSNVDEDVSDATLDKDFLSYLSLAERCVRNKDLRKCQKWFEKLCSKLYVDREAKKRRNAYLKRLLIAINKNRLIPPFDREPPVGSLSPPNEVFSIRTEGEFSKSKQGKKSVYFTRNFDRATFDRKTYTVKKPLYTKNKICGRLAVTIGAKSTKSYDSEGNLSPRRSPKKLYSSIETSSGSSKENTFIEESGDHIKLKTRLTKRISKNPSVVNLQTKLKQRHRSRSAGSGSVVAKNSRSEVAFTEPTRKWSGPKCRKTNAQRQNKVANLFEDMPHLTGNGLKPDASHPTPTCYFQSKTQNIFDDRDNLFQEGQVKNLFVDSIDSVRKDVKPKGLPTNPQLYFPTSGNDTRRHEKSPGLFEENSKSMDKNQNFKPNDTCAESHVYPQYTTERHPRESDDILYQKKLACLFEETPKLTGDNLKSEVKLTRPTYFRYMAEIAANSEDTKAVLRQNKSPNLFETSPRPARKLAGGFDQPEPPKPEKGAMDAKTDSKLQSQQDQKGQSNSSNVNHGERITRYTTYKSTTGENEKTSVLEERSELEPSTTKTTKAKSIKSRIRESLTPNRGLEKPVDVENISLTTAYDEFCSKQPSEARNTVCDLYRAYPEAIVDKLLDLWKAEGQAVIQDYKEMHKQKIEIMKKQFREDVDDKARNFQAEKDNLRRWRDCKVQLDRMMNDLPYLNGDEKEQKQLMEALRMEISEEKTKLKEETELNSKLKMAVLKRSREKENQCAEKRTHKDELKMLSERLHAELAEICKDYQEQQTMLSKIV